MPLLAWIWNHDLDPFLGPHWGNFGIRYYGLAYVLGFVAAGWLLVRYARAQRSQLPAEKVTDFMMAIILGVMIGGRLGSFLLYHPADLFNPPWAIFQIWQGGMASHGAFIGVAVAIAWFARANRISFVHLGDLVCTAAPAGIFFGRVANFINGELWGKPTDGTWGVIFANTGGGAMPRHPSQLYEAALEGLVLLAFMQWRFWRSEAVRARPGRLAGEFLLGYALVRIICEIFREPDRDVALIFGLSRGTFYSVFLIVAGLALALRKPKP